MNKIAKFIKSNIKVVVAFIIGAILFGGSAYVLATTIASSSVAYTENGQTTVEGALTDLYQKAATAGVPGDAIDFSTLNTNTAKRVLASSKGVCINRNNKLNCFKINNWAEEQNHVQQVFSDISCNVNSSYVLCYASDFRCYVRSDGDVLCTDRSDDSDCRVYSDGSVYCN